MMSNFQPPAILPNDFREIPNIMRGHAVAQLVEALRYKPEGRRFDVIGIFHCSNPSGRTMALGSNSCFVFLALQPIVVVFSQSGSGL